MNGNGMKLCDLHTHVLPGVDDGAQNLETALEMLKNAAASSVSMLAVTPHCNIPNGPENYLSPSLQQRFVRLREAAAHIPVALVLGAEAHVTEELPQLLRQGRIPTLNGSRYVLTEFPMYFEAPYFPVALQDILDCGYVPLVAHPERYQAVSRDPRMVEQWLDLGCHLQLTGGSILGRYGKTVQQTAAALLRMDYVACIASDAHSTGWRSNYLLDVYDHLCVHYAKPYAQCLMYDNPMRICSNESL